MSRIPTQGRRVDDRRCPSCGCRVRPEHVPDSEDCRALAEERAWQMHDGDD